MSERKGPLNLEKLEYSSFKEAALESLERLIVLLAKFRARKSELETYEEELKDVCELADRISGKEIRAREENKKKQEELRTIIEKGRQDLKKQEAEWKAVEEAIISLSKEDKEWNRRIELGYPLFPET